MSPARHPATPQGCTHLKLRQLSRRVAQRYDAEIARAGLKGTQYSLLSAVVKLGPIRPVDLAAAMTLDASTLSRNLQPLLAAGWVVQVPGADARSRLLSATPQGQSKRVEAQRHWRAAQRALNDTLGAERVVALHALIDEAMASLGTDDDPATEAV
jgi:DNA-binding MarR family transcriptional regulator